MSDGEAALRQGLFSKFRGLERVFGRVGTDGDESMPGIVVGNGSKEVVRLNCLSFCGEE